MFQEYVFISIFFHDEQVHLSYKGQPPEVPNYSPSPPHGTSDKATEAYAWGKCKKSLQL